MSRMLMGLYFLTILILEIRFLILAKKTKNSKNFKIFNGLFFGFLISIFIYYIYYISDVYSYDTGEWIALGEMLKSMFLCAINVIIGLVGLILQKNYKKKNLLIDTLEKGTTVKCILTLSVVSIFIVYGQYIIKNNEKQRIDNEVKQETMIYLKDKYGTKNFKIIDIHRDFAANGFVGTDYLENYDIIAIYIPDNIKFYITLDVDDSRKILRVSSKDTLTSEYYEKYFKKNEITSVINNEINNLTEFLKSQQMNVIIWGGDDSLIAYDGVPNNYGKIPSKQELYDYILNRSIKHHLILKIDKDEIEAENVELELKEYLIKLSNCIIDYYTILDDYELEISSDYSDKNGNYYKGTLSINNEYISINVGSIKEKIKREVR